MNKRVTTFSEVKNECGNTFASILKKQCDVIKVDVNKIKFTNNWYSKFSWTEDQQNKFKTWFIKYLYGNLKRTREIATSPRAIYKSKKHIADLWSWWNLQWGWKTKED